VDAGIVDDPNRVIRGTFTSVIDVVALDIVSFTTRDRRAAVNRRHGALMREPGVRCDANITPCDCGRLVAAGYDVDKRLHLGFPVFDLETVQDRALAIARPASRKEVNGGCCMASTRWTD
jgi:hypothetical protein